MPASCLNCHMVNLTQVSTLQVEVHLARFVKWLIIKVHQQIDMREGQGCFCQWSHEEQMSYAKREHKLSKGSNKVLGAGGRPSWISTNHALKRLFNMALMQGFMNTKSVVKDNSLRPD